MKGRWKEESTQCVCTSRHFNIVLSAKRLPKPFTAWQVFLLDDRLCYADAPGAAPNARYLPLDCVPVRALPRGYGPHVGVAVLEDRQVAGRAGGRPSGGPWAGAGRTFSVQCGRHTHLLSAENAEEAEVRSCVLKDAFI